MARDYNVQCRNCTKCVHAGQDLCHWCGTPVDLDQDDSANGVTARLDKLMFDVAMLRDLSRLSARDKRGLDAALANLNGVRKRQSQTC